ncbi:MAG: hypothetical protein IJR55_02595 [Clostridia bacterium]|nr:hypothetical protein [Clostridia bacterium]
MKKFISLALIMVILIFSVISCGTKNDAETTSATTTAETTSQTTAETTAQTTTTATTTTTTTTTASPVTPPSEIDENVYHSYFIDLTFTKPDSWIYYSKEEIAAMMGIVSDMLYTDDMKAIIENSDLDIDTVIEFVAANMRTGETVTLTVEKKSDLINNEETNINYLKLLLPQSFVNTEITFGQTSNIVLGVTPFKKINAYLNINGMELEQTYYICLHDGYVVSITTSTSFGTPSETFEAMFS